MKISEFAGKYDINASTVRYYIEKAMLTPKRENGQYIFDDICKDQMEMILKYKKYMFSLEEIALIGYYEAMTDLKDEEVIAEILNILNKKVLKLEEEISEREQIISSMKEEISKYKAKSERLDVERQGNIPIEALEVLSCPVCGKSLGLHEADVMGGKILKGNLVCDCGYNANISNGIVLCDGRSEDTPFKMIKTIESVLSNTYSFSTAYRNLIDKAHLWMYQQISSGHLKYKTVLAGPFSYNFMMGYIKNLPDDSIYIVAEESVNKLKMLQRYFSGTNKKILFIAGKIEELPIHKNCIDLYVDDFSFQNQAFAYGKNLYESIADMFSKKCKVVGIASDFSAAGKSLENIKKNYEYVRPELLKIKKIYSTLTEARFKLKEENDIGTTNGEQYDFEGNIAGEKISIVAYSAVRE